MIYERVMVLEKVKENTRVYTLFFKNEMKVKPGQFAMVWIPGVDEFPMSFSYTGEVKGFTFRVVGKGTSAFSSLEKGDVFFIRGPYGNSYTELGESALFLAGGTGISSLAPFIEISGFRKKVLVIGARNAEDLYFLERLKNYVDELLVFTEDGTYGMRGLATDGLSDKYDTIYTCGPEKMVRKILDFSVEKGVNMQASLERIMKCGIGICDSCTINGYRVCADGPVFSKVDLTKMHDLGNFTRSSSGRKVKL